MVSPFFYVVQGLVLAKETLFFDRFCLVSWEKERTQLGPIGGADLSLSLSLSLSLRKTRSQRTQPHPERVIFRHVINNLHKSLRIVIQSLCTTLVSSYECGQMASPQLCRKKICSTACILVARRCVLRTLTFSVYRFIGGDAVLRKLASD